MLYAFIALAFAFHARAQHPEAEPAAPETQQAVSGLIHFGDLIDVDVVGSFEYDWRGTLTPEGYLDGLEKITTQIYGLCRSEADVAEAITKEYALTLREPKVVVRILDRSNRAVAYLNGAVRLPQRFQIRRPVHLNELLIMSGGITDTSSGDVRIFRPQNLNCETPVTDATSEKTVQNIVIAIPDLLAGKPGANPRISSGDIITVTEAGPVFLIGGVKAPKQISLRTETTLSRAIAMAGGLSKQGMEDSVRIFRRDAKGPRTIETSLRKILAKEIEDPLLQAFDVVDVEEKGRGPRKMPPIADPKATGQLSKLPLRIVD